MEKLKGLLYSKTFWVNLLMAAVMILPEITKVPELSISKELMGTIVLVVNVILRMLTNKPLEGKIKKLK